MGLSNASEAYFTTLEVVAASLYPTIPRAAELTEAILARDVPSMLGFTGLGDPQSYGSAEMYFSHAQVAALIKKYPFTPQQSGLDPEISAWAKFQATERRVRRINLRFRTQRSVAFRRVQPLLELARKWIAKVLGASPDLERIYDQCDFTSGASCGVHGDATNLGRKLRSSEWSVTCGALPYAIGALWRNSHVREMMEMDTAQAGSYPWKAVQNHRSVYLGDRNRFSEYVHRRCKVVATDIIGFVPKTAKIHRSIAVQPLLQGYLQKGVDLDMRASLRKYEIDLSDQRPNKVMALLGSLGLNGWTSVPKADRAYIMDYVEHYHLNRREWETEFIAKVLPRLSNCGRGDPYVTLDLAAASDSLATELVRYLLPYDWFDFLNQLRSPCYTYGGNTYRYEKFASMGNGFCFPLETLIFAALAHAVCTYAGIPHDLRVYGDDIVVRQSAALTLIELLGVCGFSTNRDKSFFHGPFRESCGADWYDGQAVRPVYMDNPLDDIRRVFSLHNSFRNVFAPNEPIFSHLRAMVPAKYRFHRPEEGRRQERYADDTCFTVPHDIFMGCCHSRYVASEQRWAWKEVLSSPIPDAPCSGDPNLQALMEYLAVLRGASSSVPLAIRRKTKARARLVTSPSSSADLPTDDVMQLLLFLEPEAS